MSKNDDQKPQTRQSITVLVKGHEVGELIEGLEEIRRLLEEGLVCGMNRTGEKFYSFVVSETN